MKKGGQKTALLIWFMHITGQYSLGDFEIFNETDKGYLKKKKQNKSCFPFSSKLFSSPGKVLSGHKPVAATCRKGS